MCTVNSTKEPNANNSANASYPKRRWQPLLTTFSNLEQNSSIPKQFYTSEQTDQRRWVLVGKRTFQEDYRRTIWGDSSQYRNLRPSLPMRVDAVDTTLKLWSPLRCTHTCFPACIPMAGLLNENIRSLTKFWRKGNLNWPDCWYNVRIQWDTIRVAFSYASEIEVMEDARFDSQLEERPGECRANNLRRMLVHCAHWNENGTLTGSFEKDYKKDKFIQ